MNTGKLILPQIIEANIQLITDQLHARGFAGRKRSQLLMPDECMCLRLKRIEITSV